MSLQDYLDAAAEQYVADRVAEGVAAAVAAAVASRDAQITALNNQVTTLNGQVATLNAQNATLSSEKAALTAQVSALNAQIVTLNARIAELEAGGGTTNPPPPSSLYGWQLTGSNTGLAGAGVTTSQLTAYTGPFTVPANTTLTRRRIDLGGNQLVLGAGAKLVECLITTSRVGAEGSIRGGRWNDPYTSGQQIIDCDIQGPNTTAGEVIGIYFGAGENVTIRGNRITGCSIGIWHDSDASQSAGSLIEENYITTTTVGQAHKDGFTRRNGRTKLTLRNNRIDTSGNYVTGAVFLQDTWGNNNIGNVDFVGNYFEGAGYLVGTPAVVQAPLTMVNNRFRAIGYGPVSSGGYNWPTWTENYVYSSTATDAKGAVVPEP